METSIVAIPEQDGIKYLEPDWLDMVLESLTYFLLEFQEAVVSFLSLIGVFN